MNVLKSGVSRIALGAVCALFLISTASAANAPVTMAVAPAPAPAVAAPAAAPVAAPAALNATDMATLKQQYERPKDIPYPDDNPYTDAKANLGKVLYFDPRISASGTQSCATCHNPAFSWTDGMGLGVGSGHKQLGRKSPTILNLAWDNESQSYMWDGRKISLEDQATGPMFSAAEMGTEATVLLGKLKEIEGYKPLFQAAFPNEKDQITTDTLSKAIATYERTVVSAEAPFDKWIKGDETAMSASAKNGFVLFNKKANCAACHSGWRFSDGSFHDIGMNDTDVGRGKFLPNVVAMQQAFKTVGLRNIALRAPYMHNGSLKTLMDVINHYDHEFVKRASLADDIKPLHLTEQEKNDLVEFLKSLTSNDPEVSIPLLPK